VPAALRSVAAVLSVVAGRLGSTAVVTVGFNAGHQNHWFEDSHLALRLEV
jgi:hypothetical protein